MQTIQFNSVGINYVNNDPNHFVLIGTLVYNNPHNFFLQQDITINSPMGMIGMRATLEQRQITNEEAWATRRYAFE
ncbi:hypothetical protein FACS1894152_1810 [Bacilli bacterium]|nr:hypothetical protein FACS1894152_1810 [Bacilli bacterium]